MDIGYLAAIKRTHKSLVNRKYELDKAQRTRRDKALAMINFEEGGEDSISKQRRRRRLHKFLARVAQASGQGAAFLCIISVAISQLDDANSKLAAPFEDWWTQHVKDKDRLHKLAHTELDTRVTDFGRLTLRLDGETTCSTAQKRCHSDAFGDDGQEEEGASQLVHASEEANINLAAAKPTEQQWTLSNVSSNDSEDDVSVLEETQQRSPVLPTGNALGGFVFKLSPMDLVRVACQGGDQGEPNILLTIPGFKGVAPFITVPCGREMSIEFARKRPRIM